MRGAVVLGIAILSAASWHSAAEARGGRGGGGYGGGTVVRVGGYVNSRGTYVAPYYRTKPDGILSNNLSYRGGSSSYALRGSVPIASADPQDVPAATIAAVSQPTAPKAAIPWCSSGTVVGGFCVLH